MKGAIRQVFEKIMSEDMKALIVDTRAERARMLKNCMTILNYHADIAGSGHEAISSLSSMKYNMAVIGDYVTPVSGLDLCKQIRAKFPEIDVIDLSCSDDLNRFWKAVAVACL